MKLKMNDLVQLMRGKEAGKQGKIISIDRSGNRVKVEGLAKVTKHVKPSQGQPGEIVQKEMYIHASNVMVVCPETKKPTRVVYMRSDKGKKFRVSKKSGKPLDK